MALIVTITGNVNVIEGGITVLDTHVIDDSTGLVPTRSLTYSWLASEGEFIGVTDSSSVVYSTQNVVIPADDTSTNVIITCTVEIPGIPNPTVTTPLSLTTLEDIGITGIVVNMLIQTVVSDLDLYDSTSLAAGSDDLLYENVDTLERLTIDRIRWLSGNRLNLDRHSTSDQIEMRHYWLPDNDGLNHRTTQSVYIINSDGDILELGNARFSNVGASFATWVIPPADTEDVSIIADIGDDETIILGIADSASLGFDAEEGESTVTVTVSEDTESIERLIVTFDYDETVNYGGNVDITANVIDRETGEEPTSVVGYAWVLETSTVGSISPTNAQTISYTATSTGNVPLSVLVSCTVTSGSDEVTKYILLRIPGHLAPSDSTFSRKVVRAIIDKINVGFLDRLLDNTGFNKIDGIEEKPLESFGIAQLFITIGYNAGSSDDEDIAYPSRYRAAKVNVPFSSRINGASEMSGNYIVILQPIRDKDGNNQPPAAGEEGRNFVTYGVYDKINTGFKISYQEGISVEAYDSENLNVLTGSPSGIISVKVAWFARGW